MERITAGNVHVMIPTQQLFKTQSKEKVRKTCLFCKSLLFVRSAVYGIRFLHTTNDGYFEGEKEKHPLDVMFDDVFSLLLGVQAILVHVREIDLSWRVGYI